VPLRSAAASAVALAALFATMAEIVSPEPDDNSSAAALLAVSLTVLATFDALALRPSNGCPVALLPTLPLLLLLL